MSPKLKNEIKQNKPFESLEAEVFINLLRTADALSRGAEGILKLAGLSQTQYNVLRILRGAGKNGLCCREAGPIQEFNRNRLGHMAKVDLRKLVRLLEAARESP